MNRLVLLLVMLFAFAAYGLQEASYAEDPAFVEMDEELEVDEAAFLEAEAEAEAEAEMDEEMEEELEADEAESAHPLYEELAREGDNKPVRYMTADEILDADGIAKINFKPAAEPAVNPATPKWMLDAKTYDAAEIVDAPSSEPPTYV